MTSENIVTCEICFVAIPHAHVVFPLRQPHFFICSLLQVYPVRSPFSHRHVSQGLSYLLAGSSLETTTPKRNLSLDLLGHCIVRLLEGSMMVYTCHEVIS